ncbi:MAG: heavy-metal-associated domain-containing protein [Gemmataceae bacterium]
MTRTYKTTLRCGGCVNTIAPLLDSASGIASWKADVESPDKLLTLDGDDVGRKRVESLLGQAGYTVTGEVFTLPGLESVPALKPPEPRTSFFPLFLIVSEILGVTLLVESLHGSFDPGRAMSHFMGGFFLVFSFFKLLDVRAFAEAYRMYDLVAARSKAYAFAYPFLELGLAIAYLLRLAPMLVNAVTLVVMLVSLAGVLRTVLAKRKIRCACLGAVFNLPMTYVTVAEDGVMALMAAAMLVMELAGGHV